jgi:hypothetical protein
MSNIVGNSSVPAAQERVEQQRLEGAVSAPRNLPWAGLALAAFGAFFSGEARAQSGPSKTQDSAVAKEAEPKNVDPVAAPAKPAAVEPLPELTGVEPILGALHQGFTIKAPAGGEKWVEFMETLVTISNAELAKFGIKPVRDGRIIVVGDQENYDKLTSQDNKGGFAIWRTTGDKDGATRIVLMKAPIKTDKLASYVAEGAAVINIYAAQGNDNNERTIQSWCLSGIIQQALLAKAALVEGVPRTETAEYRKLIDNALSATVRPSAFDILTDKEDKGADIVKRVISRAWLEVMMPDESTKAGAAQAKEFKAIVTELVTKPRSSDEPSRAETADVAQRIVKALKLEDWFKKAGKDKELKAKLAELGYEIDSKEFRESLKDKAGKDFKLLDVYFAWRLDQAGQHVDALKLKGLTLVDAGNEGKAKKDEVKK